MLGWQSVPVAARPCKGYLQPRGHSFHPARPRHREHLRPPLPRRLPRQHQSRPGVTATAAPPRPPRPRQHTLDAAVRARLESTLPADAAERCSGRGFVAVTRVEPSGPDVPLLLGERYADKSDVVAAGD
jgi:hypothetical protein